MNIYDTTCYKIPNRYVRYLIEQFLEFQGQDFDEIANLSPKEQAKLFLKWVEEDN